MVTLVVVAIIAAVAIPAYHNYVLRSYASTGENGLIAQAAAMSRFAQDNSTFVGSCATTLPTTNFTLSCSNLTTTGYLITATGTGPAQGFVFTLDNLGNKQTTGAPNGWRTNAGCWITDSAGNCAVQ